MRGSDNRTTENEVAFAICQIGKTTIDGVVRFSHCRKEIPNYLKLSVEDQAQSQTRPNEEVWEQLIRNIKSHSNTEGNYICEGYLIHVPRVGYRVTEAGKKRTHP